MQNRFGEKAVWIIPFVLASGVLLQTALGQNEPTNQPSPSPMPLWSELAENRSCPNSDCPAGRGFIVESDGEFRAERGATGFINQEELQRLVESGNTVALEELSGELTCDASGAEANVNVTLKKIGQPSATIVYEGRGDGTLCHRGKTGDVVALKNELDQLAQRYDSVQGDTIPVPVQDCAGMADGISCGRGFVPCGPRGFGSKFVCKQDRCVEEFTPCGECEGIPDTTACGPVLGCPPGGGAIPIFRCRQSEGVQVGNEVCPSNPCAGQPDGTECGRENFICPPGTPLAGQIGSITHFICQAGNCSGAFVEEIGCFPPVQPPPEELPPGGE